MYKFSVYISNVKSPIESECKQEDEIIIDLVNRYGPKKWSTIAQHLPGRIGKQCRERYGGYWISIVLCRTQASLMYLYCPKMIN